MSDDNAKVEKTPRSAETRAKMERAAQWVRPDVLPNPDPRPGWVHRYVRTSLMGEPDNKNASMKFREMWEPVQAADYPELMVVSDRDSDWGEKGYVEQGGLLLCRAPEEMVKQRREYFTNLAEQQMEAVDNAFMRENDPRMPLLPIEKKTKVTMGGGQ